MNIGGAMYEGIVMVTRVGDGDIKDNVIKTATKTKMVGVVKARVLGNS